MRWREKETMSSEKLEELINEYAAVSAELEAVWRERIMLWRDVPEVRVASHGQGYEEIPRGPVGRRNEDLRRYRMEEREHILDDREEGLLQLRGALRARMARLMSVGEEYRSRAGHRVRKDADGQVVIRLAEA